MAEHRDLIGAALHPPKAVVFTGDPAAYVPPASGILVVCDTAPNVGKLYRTTGTTAGALAVLAAGVDGVAATVSIGDVVTGAAGSPAVVSNSGTSGAAVLDFEIPQGVQGTTGPAGVVSATSALVLTEQVSAPNTAADEIKLGNVGNVLQWRLESGGSTYTVAQRELEENAQTGTTYTLTLADAFRGVTLSNAAAITLTVPLNSGVAIPVGTQILIGQKGAGLVTITPGAGVTINGATANLVLSGQWAMVTLWKYGADAWWAVGGLS